MIELYTRGVLPDYLEGQDIPELIEVAEKCHVGFSATWLDESKMYQLDNLIDTLSVDDVTEAPHVQRELCLVKVAADASNRSVLTGISDIFRGRVVNITTETMTFEVSGPPAKINGFIGMMDEYTILEVARSGRIAMRRKMEFEEDAE